MLLERYLFYTEVCKRLWGAIINYGADVDFRPIFDWLHISLTSNIGDNQPSPLAMLRPTASMMYGNLLRHRHNFVIHHLPGQDPPIQRAQGYLITTNIQEFTVELHQDCEENVRVHEQV